ncbi:NmrA family NAD(P)-binding protein [Maribacter aurantiacus]|uniref:NmrA family transcriptional regulator n=1 Tax=Maribacter aurantiacus TaxID=1882343 RepID=A0A5R8M5N5_9FLAO|nr:NmrA family NAD(P)-binding protein [Maribacter aurantiacus]TLF44805.1 NmrA family transcriptional regulator [Maribacter aurantiacus]
MKTENILVIGGSGKTGRRVAENLMQVGHNVRIVGRKTTPAFDWENPETYDDALKDMDRAYIVYYPDLAVPGSRDAITTLTDKALEAGLEKVVLLSGKGESEAEACEEIVANSGLNYTLVRASWFNQNFSEGAFLDFILNGTVALPMPQARIPFVDVNDIADVVTKVLLDDSYNGRTITVTGPQKRTFKEVVGIMAEASKKHIQFVPISIDEFKEGMRKAGLPDSYVWLFGYLFKEVLGNPENQEVSDDVAKVLGRPAIDFETFAFKTAGTGVWNQKTKEVSSI